MSGTKFIGCVVSMQRLKQSFPKKENGSKKFRTKGLLFFIFSLFCLMLYPLYQRPFEIPSKQFSAAPLSFQLEHCEKWILSPHSFCHLQSPESLLRIEEGKLLQKYENASIDLAIKNKKSHLTSSRLENDPKTGFLIAHNLSFYTEELKGKATKAIIPINGQEISLEGVRLEQVETP